MCEKLCYNHGLVASYLTHFPLLENIFSSLCACFCAHYVGSIQVFFNAQMCVFHNELFFEIDHYFHCLRREQQCVRVEC